MNLLIKGYLVLSLLSRGWVAWSEVLTGGRLGDS